MATEFKQTLEVDDPVALDSTWRPGVSDRRLIDDQIRDLQEIALATSIKGVTATYATLSSDSASVAKGGFVMPTENGEVTKVTEDLLATTAVIFGIAAEATSPGATMLVITGGLVPSTMVGLDSSAEGYVQMSSAPTLDVDAALYPNYRLLGHASGGYFNLNIQPEPIAASGGGGGDVYSTLMLTAGTGLTGGGSLAANRTFNVAANADGSIVANADDIQVGILATDAQHGNRGGGGIHANADGSTAGFMPSALYTIANNFVAQSKSSNFTVSAARFQRFTVDVNGGDVTATLPTSSRVAGDLILFDILNASTNKLIASASDTTLPAEFSSGSSTSLSVTSITAGNGGAFALRWDGTKWVVVDHPRLRWNMAQYGGYGLDAGYWVSPIHRWEPKDALYLSERTQQLDIVTTTNNTVTTVSSRTHSTASRMVVAKMVARGVNTADSTGEAVEIRCSAMFKKDSAGNLTQIGTTDDEGKTPSATALTWAATIAIGSTNVIDFKVTGETGKTIDWFVTIQTSDCKYA